jgi:hypothetical protein
MDPAYARDRPVLLYAIESGANWWLREFARPFQGMSLTAKDR